MLLELGASTMTKNERGETPHDTALRFNRLALKEMLTVPSINVAPEQVNANVHALVDQNRTKDLLALIKDN
jgi:hypothetical protein